MPATPIWSLNFKRAWQAQCLSHTYEILEKYVFFIDLWMILVPFFEILDGVCDKNFFHSCHIHILSHPWSMTLFLFSILVCTNFQTVWGKVKLGRGNEKPHTCGCGLPWPLKNARKFGIHFFWKSLPVRTQNEHKKILTNQFQNY